MPNDMMSADATDALKAAVSALPAITSPLFALASASILTDMESPEKVRPVRKKTKTNLRQK